MESSDHPMVATMNRVKVNCLMLSMACFASSLSTATALPTSTPDLAQPNIPTMSGGPKRAEMPLEFFNFLKDCFIVNVSDGQHQYAAWLPLQTFVRMYAAGGGDTAQLEPKVKDLKSYLMFVVENRTYDQFKNPISESAESLRARIKLRFPDGTEVRAVDKTPDGMPTNAPTFGNLGRRGQLLIFPSEGHIDLDAENASKSKIQLILDGNDAFKASSFTWHLPLELSGTTKQCSKCHNELSAKWSFCPWCGIKQKK